MTINDIIDGLSASMLIKSDAALLSEAVRAGAHIEAPANAIGAGTLASIWAGRSRHAATSDEAQRFATLAAFFSEHRGLHFRVIAISGKHCGAIYLSEIPGIAACLTWVSD